MATWEDGPEYAPAVRPDAFVTPDAAPLAPAASPTEAGQTVPVGAPAPEYEAPVGDIPALASISAPAAPQRDPREAFDVETTPVASAPVASAPVTGTPATPAPGVPGPGDPTSAWGAAHAPQAQPRPQQAWAPDRPFAPPQAPPMQFPAPAPTWPPPQVNPSPFPPPQVPDWYGHQQYPAPPGGPLRPVSLGQMATAATPAVVITLVVGGIVTPLALPLYLVASVLATRVHHRRSRVQLAFRIGLAASVLLGTLSAWWSLRSIDFFLLWDHVTGWGQLACWVVGAAVLLIQGDALRRNEPPEGYP